MTKWKNRMLAYIALAILMGIIAVAGSHSMQASDKMDLVTIADILGKKDNLNIEEWSVFAREINNEITTKEEFEKKVNVLKKEYPEFHWNQASDEVVWKAEASLPHVQDNLTEWIRMVTTVEHNNNVTYIIYEVKGQKWEDKQAILLEKIFQQKLNHIFIENPSVFTCVKGSINDNMDSVFVNSNMKTIKHV